jgi:hypothetical protein
VFWETFTLFYFTGDQESNAKACEMILSKIVEDPLSGSCLNVSYAHALGPVANNCPTGSPFANLGGQRTPAGSFGSTASLNSSVAGSMYNLLVLLSPLYAQLVVL